MGTFSEIYHSSVGKKFVVGLTGLFLCSFLIVHLSGNFLLFKKDGGAAFDVYSHFMSTNGLIRIIEIVLVLGFVGHIFTGFYLWYKNKEARPVQYKMNNANANSKLSARTMFVSGSIIFIFLIVHLQSFFVPSRFAPEENPSMYAVVKQAFASPLYDMFYVVAIALLGFHLHHGFQSAFQTFGIKHKKYASLIEAIGVVFWLLIPLGYISMPLYFLFNPY